MRKPRRVLLILVALSILPVLANGWADQAAERAARKAADDWLALVDSSDYEASWDEAATIFKSRVSKEQWVKLAESVRGPLGELKSRELLSATYTKELPGVPDGEYVVIQFKASYANKASAVETVTPMLDKDGHWRVSGYRFK